MVKLSQMSLAELKELQVVIKDMIFDIEIDLEESDYEGSAQ